MRTSSVLAALLCSALMLTSAALAADDDAMSLAKYYLRTLEGNVAVAKEKPEAPSAWQQCEMTLQGFESAVAKLPEADRAPFQAKINQYKPAIIAGATRNRAGFLVRRIRSYLDGAWADIAAGNTKPANMASTYYEKLDQYFAEEDLKALPAEELKKLQAEYAEVKKKVGN